MKAKHDPTLSVVLMGSLLGLALAGGVTSQVAGAAAVLIAAGHSYVFKTVLDRDSKFSQRRPELRLMALTKVVTMPLWLVALHILMDVALVAALVAAGVTWAAIVYAAISGYDFGAMLKLRQHVAAGKPL